MCKSDFYKVKVVYLHLRAQHGVVAGQLCAVDGVHSEACRVRRALGGSVMELEKCLNISTVLIGLSLLILICPLPDTRLPPFSRVLIQHTCFTGGVLSEREEQKLHGDFTVSHNYTTMFENKTSMPFAVEFNTT